MNYTNNIEDCAPKAPQAELINLLIERDITYDKMNLVIESIEAHLHKLSGYKYIFREEVSSGPEDSKAVVEETTFISETKRQKNRSNKIFDHLRQIEDELFKVIGK